MLFLVKTFTQFKTLLALELFDLTTDYFALFGIKQSYQLDLVVLKAKYLELQRQVHPDNFASGSEKQQREAMQSVSYLNQAYESLKSPLQRAIYLLQLANHGFDPDTQVHSDTEFLFGQMELREELSETSNADDPLAVLDNLRHKAEASYREYQQQFSSFYDQKNWQLAATEINKMMFASKLISEISEKEETLF